MALSTQELARAREATASLLDELEVSNYLFEVGMAEGGYRIRLERASAAGWETAWLPVERDRLLSSDDDPRQRQQLLQEWARRLHLERSR